MAGSFGASSSALGIGCDLRYVAQFTNAVHVAFIHWSTRVLEQAGIEGVEVLGQFHTGTPSRPYVALFPYRVGPDPKLMETGQGFSLLDAPAKSRGHDVPWPVPTGRTAPGVRSEVEEIEAPERQRSSRMPDSPREDPRASVVAPGWMELGRALSAAVPLALRLDRRRLPSPDELPAPLRAWYLDAPAEWRGDGDQPGEVTARYPTLWWRPGVVLTVRYIAVAHDLGRGITGETSAAAPLALPSLSVLATAMQVQRVIRVDHPNVPPPPHLGSYVQAVAASLAAHPLAERLTAAWEALREEVPHEVAIQPVHDLNNHEFATLMQALQQRLQAALNLQIRLTLGTGIGFSPSLAVQVHARGGQR